MIRQFLGDRYEPVAEIGRGGAARVYRANRVADGTPVALKVLRPELLASLTAKRFLREISVLQQLEHEHIARLLDYGEAEWLVYYVAEFVDGLTLRAWLDRHKQAPFDQTLARSMEILEAVEHAHSKSIIHRDIKPENIVLSRRGAVLLDFGIARAVSVSEEQRVTRSGFTVGTSSYMSPEQALGQGVDHRSDLYSLGCVLYECLAGKPPYQHPLESQVLVQHQKAPVPDLREARPDVPRPLRKFIERALSKNPGERYQSATEMRRVLGEIRTTTGTSPLPPR